MGLHSYFQQKNIPFGSVMSKVWNKKIFQNIQEKVDEASKTLADERGSCPDAAAWHHGTGASSGFRWPAGTSTNEAGEWRMTEA